MKTLSSAVLASALGLAIAAPAQAAVVSFTGGGVSIPNSGAATPYPTTIAVSGLTGPVLKLEVALLGLSHTFPDDIGVLLVSPSGQNVVLMNGAGSSVPLVNIDLLFADDGAVMPSSGNIPAGTYAPSNYFPGDTFPGLPGPPPYGTTLAPLAAGTLNGDWGLFIYDFVGGDSGAMRNWRLDFTVADDGTPLPTPGTAALLGLALLGLALRRGKVPSR